MKILFRDALVLFIFWIAISVFILFNNEIESTRTTILLLRSFSFSGIYMVILFPLCFYHHLKNIQSYIFVIFYSLLITISIVILMAILFYDVPTHLHKKYAPNYLKLFLLYSSIFFAVISVGYNLSSKCGIWVSTVLFLALTNILWANSILHFSFARFMVLHSNPLIALSRCYENYDILRTGKVYEICHLASNYPFEYPHYYKFLSLYIAVGIFTFFTKKVLSKLHL